MFLCFLIFKIPKIGVGIMGVHILGAEGYHCACECAAGAACLYIIVAQMVCGLCFAKRRKALDVL